jgi:SSS family solute:Na+ symporter
VYRTCPFRSPSGYTDAVNAPTAVLLAAYAVSLLALSAGRRAGGDVEYLLAGRRLTLPGFVATLVTTWYGGILVIGEYSFNNGISTWLVFGVPYYVAAILFAVVLAPRLRRTEAMSIPDLLRAAYGDLAGHSGAVAIYLITLPLAYVLVLGMLLGDVTGWPVWAAMVVAAAFSALYVSFTGFKAVVRTDIFQFVLMYGGFLILLPVALDRVGGLSALWAAVPEGHRQWDGGLGWQPVVVWYFIALQTLVEPTFYQRVFAASSPRTARRGILVSVLLWAVFDFLTVFSGLAARVLLPDLASPPLAYPALADAVLPPWLAAVFTVGLFAIVMSTLDSYLFLAAATLGHDFPGKARGPRREHQRTRLALFASAALSVGGALLFTSAVEIWKHVGSIVISTLLLPVLTVHLRPSLRFSPRVAVLAMAAAAAVSTTWIAFSHAGSYPLNIEPLFVALAASGACWIVNLLYRRLAAGW